MSPEEPDAARAPRTSLEDTQKAILNILEDAGLEEKRLRESQRAVLNILADFAADNGRLEKLQAAVLNILDDFAAEKRHLEDMHRALLNILEDLGVEKARLEQTKLEVQRSEREVRASLREKEVLLKEIHHRVKNNLQVIASLLNLQRGHVEDARTLDALVESQTRVRSIALVHEKLYRSQNLHSIELGAYLASLVGHLFDTYGPAGPIRYSLDVDDVSLDVDLAVHCGLLVNELVSNALKHAFKDRVEGTVAVAAKRHAPGGLLLSIRDDGAGFPEHLDFRRSPSLGLQLVTTLARQLGGELVMRRGAGTEFALLLKLPGQAHGS